MKYQRLSTILLDPFVYEIHMSDDQLPSRVKVDSEMNYKDLFGALGNINPNGTFAVSCAYQYSRYGFDVVTSNPPQDLIRTQWQFESEYLGD